jgi:hypothetical protein
MNWDPKSTIWLIGDSGQVGVEDRLMLANSSDGNRITIIGF